MKLTQLITKIKGADTMAKSAFIIINPTAGREQAIKYEKQIIHTLKDTYPNITVEHTKGEKDATRFAKKAAEDHYDLVVTLGGDGTINEAVNGLAPFNHPPKLGIIPMGTVNNLARSLNIPMKPDDAIELLLSGTETKIDIGVANSDTYFTDMLGIGDVAKAIHSVEIEEKSKIGSIAYAKAITKEILDDQPFPIKLEMEANTWEGDVSAVLFLLIDSIGGFQTIVDVVEKGDGYFHVFAIKQLNLAEVTKMTPSILTGNLPQSDNVQYFKARSIKITSDGEDRQESAIDGEQGPNLPIDIKVLHQHITVISNEA